MRLVAAPGPTSINPVLYPLHPAVANSPLCCCYRRPDNTLAIPKRLQLREVGSDASLPPLHQGETIREIASSSTNMLFILPEATVLIQTGRRETPLSFYSHTSRLTTFILPASSRTASPFSRKLRDYFPEIGRVTRPQHQPNTGLKSRKPFRAMHLRDKSPLPARRNPLLPVPLHRSPLVGQPCHPNPIPPDHVRPPAIPTNPQSPAPATGFRALHGRPGEPGA